MGPLVVAGPGLPFVEEPMTTEQKQQMVDEWNDDMEIGDLVDVRLDCGEIKRTKTRSAAHLLGGHTPVVWLEGISGCYGLDRVTAVFVECGACSAAGWADRAVMHKPPACRDTWSE